jgi:hypothetical protein
LSTVYPFVILNIKIKKKLSFLQFLDNDKKNYG